MGSHSNAAPVIIKKKKVIAAGGHHGGAWKVAYADFVTAMMAFFMLMWLLNATTEKQRKGIADYFNPNVPINRISGGGDAMFGGDSVFAKDVLAKNGVGGMPKIDGLDGPEGRAKSREPETAAESKRFEKVQDFLVGNGGESLISENAMKHVVTKLTDEGLVIELFDLEGLPLFVEGEDTPNPELESLIRLVVAAAKKVGNHVAVAGHLRSEPVVIAQSKVWMLSSMRADKVRRLLVAEGLEASRVDRVTGHADRDLVDDDPRSLRNNRIEIILLRETGN
ncbi:flagellar motor protein MotB [Shimia sediminis]|uniref:flagellar motor protein MotB n=1 Tax=Shimia sediminis TaxID=2497945 RepID=UPI000F8E8060|nr:flagellar motor protein MotB [Shimia sediminis]